jgi:hypothetical protein
VCVARLRPPLKTLNPRALPHSSVLSVDRPRAKQGAHRAALHCTATTLHYTARVPPFLSLMFWTGRSALWLLQRPLWRSLFLGNQRRFSPRLHKHVISTARVQGAERLLTCRLTACAIFY